jgi:putative phosphoribosyl transferase
MNFKFESRQQAGKLLAEKLEKHKGNCVVVAIPRGGVVIGEQIARKFSCPLETIVTRKLGAPGNAELAMGATTSKGGIFLDRDLVDRLDIHQRYIHDEHKKQLAEARRREKAYATGKQVDFKGKNIILVDDGIATGATIEAAIYDLKEYFPKKVIMAVPVAPAETVEKLKNIVDDFVVLSTPESFWAIGEFYVDFPQVSDEEVISILQQNQRK